MTDRADDDRGAHLPFTPYDHDVRVERGEWVLWVRGVKRGEPFLPGNQSADTGGLVEAALSLTAGLAVDWWLGRQRTWKVGVLRHRRSWRGVYRVVHRERLPPGRTPEQRIAELVTDVERGRFDET